MFIARLARALNDPDFETWSRADIAAWVKEAVATIMRKSYVFAEQRLVPLVRSQATDPDLYMVTADAITDTHGKRLYPVFMGTPGRVTCGAYFGAASEGGIAITPVLDLNHAYYLRVRAVDLNNPPEGIQAAISQWVLYRAHMIDSESSGVMSDVAKTHVTTWEAALRHIPTTNSSGGRR